MAYMNISSKPANKFILIQENNLLAFMQKVRESDSLVPCHMYVDKNDGKIYFVEQQIGPILDLEENIVDVRPSIDGNYINAEIPF